MGCQSEFLYRGFIGRSISLFLFFFFSLELHFPSSIHVYVYTFLSTMRKKTSGCLKATSRSWLYIFNAGTFNLGQRDLAPLFVQLREFRKTLVADNICQTYDHVSACLILISMEPTYRVTAEKLKGLKKS